MLWLALFLVVLVVSIRTRQVPVKRRCSGRSYWAAVLTGVGYLLLFCYLFAVAAVVVIVVVVVVRSCCLLLFACYLCVVRSCCCCRCLLLMLPLFVVIVGLGVAVAAANVVLRCCSVRCSCCRRHPSSDPLHF